MNQNINISNPKKNCALCTRLKKYRNSNIINNPNWHNAPVQSFGKLESKLLIVGLAPGLKGANRTGRPFTGDYAGDLLYTTLINYEFAAGNYCSEKKDNLKLVNTRITNSVRCVPPQNKPNLQEKEKCRKFLISEIKNMKNLRIILSLGKIAHEETIKVFQLTLNKFKFKHGNIHYLNNNIKLYNSYHCSRYNTQTKKLSAKMFNQIIKNIKNDLIKL
tara:strand:- start:1183 stop:1836 length:654 start_codon:yes stop_codon:yes gene_type:complete